MKVISKNRFLSDPMSARVLLWIAFQCLLRCHSLSSAMQTPIDANNEEWKTWLISSESDSVQTQRLCVRFKHNPLVFRRTCIANRILAPESESISCRSESPSPPWPLSPPSTLRHECWAIKSKVNRICRLALQLCSNFINNLEPYWEFTASSLPDLWLSSASALVTDALIMGSMGAIVVQNSCISVPDS